MKYQIYTGDILLRRYYGNHLDFSRDNYTNNWASGYSGLFYEAIFDDRPDNFQWKFGNDSSDCTIIPKYAGCSYCPRNDVFGFGCYNSNYGFKTFTWLNRDLTTEDSSYGVKITASMDGSFYNKSSTNYIKVSSNILFLKVLFTFFNLQLFMPYIV